MPINIFANPAKVSIYVKICISQNRNTFAIKKLRPFFIFNYVFLFIMLRAIEFYCKLLFRTVKINDVFIYYFLPTKPTR